MLSLYNPCILSSLLLLYNVHHTHFEFHIIHCELHELYFSAVKQMCSAVEAVKDLHCVSVTDLPFTRCPTGGEF